MSITKVHKLIIVKLSFKSIRNYRFTLPSVVDKELFCPDQDPVFQVVSDPEHLPFKRQLNK
jgi:hypothetical protein